MNNAIKVSGYQISSVAFLVLLYFNLYAADKFNAIKEFLVFLHLCF